MNKLITIITPSFNKADFIMQTVNSVIAQQYPHWEMIIVDDCSTDHSKHLLSNVTTLDHRITAILNEKNKGGNACRNQGLALAKGDFIIFLDADDILDANCLASRIEQVNNNLSADLYVFPMAIFKQKIGDINASQNWIPPHKNANLLYLFLKHQLPWQTMQPLWRKDFLKKINGFDENFIRLQDVELHTRALLEGAVVESFPGLAKDCNFRIDEDRFDNKVYKLLKGFTFGAVQYYKKFYGIVQNEQLQKALTGTLLEPLSNICFQFKSNKITKNEYKELTNSLINTCLISSHKRLLNYFANVYRISPVHPKGLKKIFLILLGLNEK